MTDKHAGIVCSCHQLNRAKGSRENSLAGCRDSVPAGVKGQSPLRLPYLRTFFTPFCRALSAYMASSARCMMSRMDSSL